MSKTRIHPSVKHDDRDLVQLAGYHAYKKHKFEDEIHVNGKVFIVENTEYDTESGLDALAVKNVTPLTKDGDENLDGEIIVVFVGSDQIKGDWIDTNINLIGEAEPAQLVAAKEYFKDVEDAYGTVSSVTGNSLGGALANTVAIDYPHVNSVTLNPAMLPGDVINLGQDYANITNYQTKYDVLTHAQESINRGDRIPGNNYNINGGVPLFSKIKSNHTGYVAKDGNGEFTVEIGFNGEPGHGVIHVGPDAHIVTSIWTGESLHGDTSVLININTDDLLKLSDAVKEDINGRLLLADEYIANAISIVDDEGSKFNERVTALQENLLEQLDEAFNNPIFNGVTGTGEAIIGVIDLLIELLDRAETKLLPLNSILNSAPAEFIEFVFSLDISVQTLFDPARDYLEEIRGDISEFIRKAEGIVDDDIPAAFRGVKNTVVDAVVGELDAHYSIVQRNKDAVLQQIEDYGEQVKSIADIMQAQDEEVGLAIKANIAPVKDSLDIKETSLFCIQSSSYLEDHLHIKEIQLESAHRVIKHTVIITLVPILSAIQGTLTLLDLVLESALHSIDAAVNMMAYSPGGLLVNLTSDYIQKLRDAAEKAKKPVADMQNTIKNLNEAITESINNLSDILDYFKEYIDVAIFTPARFQSVKIYNVAATDILGEMEILFNDIIYQLSNHQAKSVDDIVSSSRSVLANMELLKEDIERGAT